MNPETENYRKHARALYEDGIASLFRAFNYDNDPACGYGFGEAERARFFEMARDLYGLIVAGEMRVFPIAKARADDDFQEFMRKAKRRPRNPKGNHGAGRLT